MEQYEHLRADQVKEGDTIRFPGENLPPEVQGLFNMKITVGHIRPSGLEGKLLFRKRLSATKVYRVPVDMPVRRIITEQELKVAREAEKAKEPPAPVCKCRSHVGKYKKKYKSHKSALQTALQFYKKHGMQAVYECPSVPGIYHVTTADQKKFRE